MIQKVIHYCWFGGNEKPYEIHQYIKSWQTKCPDYKIVEWNERNFDVNISAYTKEAYAARKWAFVTDYVRLYVLYKYGGIYMDTDVKVVKNLDPLLCYDAFSGYESTECIPTGTLGACKGNEWIKMLLDDYKYRHFIMPNGKYDFTTNVTTITRLTAEKYGLKLDGTTKLFGRNMIILPFEYLCAKSFDTGEIFLTNNTYTIHNFNGSWLTDNEKVRVNILKKLSHYIGKRMARLVSGAFYYVYLEGVKKLCLRLLKKE